MRTLHALFSAALLAVTASAANAAAIVDIQFSNSAGSAQSGAAVIGSTGDTWNTFTTGNSGSGSLVNTADVATGISLSFSANTFWEGDAGYTQFTNTPYASLMQGYLVGYYQNPNIDLVFTGLTAGKEYGFWVYTQGDDNSNGRSISLTANGGAAQVATQTNAATFELDNNYVYLTAFADKSGTVDISGQDLNGEANIDGVQLTAVPEPSSLVLLMAGFAFLAGAVMRKSRAR